MQFINAQKKQLNIPNHVGYQEILQKFSVNSPNQNWPRIIQIKFNNHHTEPNQLASYSMFCIQRRKKLTCSKQFIGKIKYQDEWITNKINPIQKTSNLISVLSFAEQHKPKEWHHPIVEIGLRDGMYDVCFGDKMDMYSSSEKSRFEKKCLPIKKNQSTGLFEAIYSSIDLSEVIID